ncbi:MAG: hypothetical protein LBO82_05825 [Synergistaceae bacterium]|nr:hypothetical protein [Synergistaceae bacterium]
MKIRKTFIILLAALFGIGLLARYAFRDIALDADLLRESLQRMPSVILENLEFEREISGDLWQVRIPLAERRGGRVEVRSIDVSRRMGNGREWYFRSAAGFYSEEAGSADLISLLGTLETGSRVLNLESPYLSWTGLETEESGSDFLFPRGLLIYDNEFLLTADAASIDEKGVILLDRGGVIKWTRDEGGAPY